MKNSQASTHKYPSYKESGIEWLGEVPSHWDVSHLKRISKKITDGEHISPTFTNEGMPFLSAKDIRERKILLEVDKFVSIDEGHKFRKRCNAESGDLLMVSRGATIGRIGLVETERIFCLLGSVILIKPRKKIINNVYLYYYFNANSTQANLFFSSQASAQQAIYLQDLSKLQTAIPPLPEQIAIANYLDTHTAKIDKKIELLTKKATLYANLKQSLINETVTRGLNKKVRRKDSGIEWIGEIPEHWDVKRVKTLFSESKLKSNTGNEPLLQVSEYTGVTLKKDSVEENDFLSNAETLVGYKLCKVNDLVINIMLAWKCGLGVSPFDGIVSPSYAVYTPNKFAHPKFFHYLFRSEEAIKEFKRNSTGIIESRLRLYTDSFFSLSVALPPLHEQAAIADYLDKKTKSIEQIIETIHLQIEKLKELRKALVNDVVTGKIRVADNG